MIQDTKAAVNDPFIFILAVCVLLFVLIIFFLVFFLVRYRRSRNPHPADISGNVLLESLWIIGATLIVLPMFFYAYKGFQYLRTPPPRRHAGDRHCAAVVMAFRVPQRSEKRRPRGPPGRERRAHA